ncbi:MAG TPA: GNAT family N-acetyltransferase, partial [Holophaga sp.]|nr:GNAT family N-acetyltransferase [Holophaga sp.]
FVLEVLQENEAAIKAYERTGFRISRPWDCFQLEGPPRPVDSGRWAIRPIPVGALEAFAGELDWLPSWENGLDAIRAVSDEVRLAGAFEGGACVGVAAWHPFFRWLMLLVVARSHRGRGIGSALLDHVLAEAGSEGRPPRANNVDPADAGLVHLLERAGFVRFTSQYEMVCDLS